MRPDIEAMKADFVGRDFDSVEIDVVGDEMVRYARACGETRSCYVDPTDSDFRAVPNYAARFHGTRALPKGFPLEMRSSFDAGKRVESSGEIRAGDKLVARSQIHDVYEKTGRSGTMMFVVHRMEFTNQVGEKIATVDWRMVQRYEREGEDG